MAPEMIEGHVLPYRASFLCCDVYSLALLLWEMLARTEAHPSCTSCVTCSVGIVPVLSYS